MREKGAGNKSGEIIEEGEGGRGEGRDVMNHHRAIKNRAFGLGENLV